jgi:hypothetical protein
MSFTQHTLIFDQYLNKKDNKIPGLTINEDSVLAELHTKKAPKISITTDIAYGYFRTLKEATWNFVNMLKEIYEQAIKEYEKSFGKFE